MQTSTKEHTHAYPFDDSNLITGHGEPRMHEQSLKSAAEATKKSAQKGTPSSVKGVKGYSWFMLIPKVDIIRGVDSEDAGESSHEGYMLKEEHGENCHVGR